MAYDPCLLAASNILVIAPHPDDELLGCGGLISKLAAHGRCFYTIFVTDGGASHLASAKWSRHALMACREREANDALCQLGIGNHPRMFLRLSDAAMPPVSSRLWRSALKSTGHCPSDFSPRFGAAALAARPTSRSSRFMAAGYRSNSSKCAHPNDSGIRDLAGGEWTARRLSLRRRSTIDRV